MLKTVFNKSAIRMIEKSNNRINLILTDPFERQDKVVLYPE